MSLERDLLFMKIAYLQAKDYSANPDTNTGAVLVHPNYGLIGVGANKFPEGIEFDKSKLVKPEIYDWLDHSEEGAFRQAVNENHFDSISESTLYTPWIPCSGCARDAIGYNVLEVVMHKELNDFDKKVTDAKWGQEASLEMFERKGIPYRFIEGKIFPDDFTIRFRGYDFSP